MPRLLILARHGESVVTAAHLLNGDPNRIAGLTPHGRWQARRMGDELRHLEIDLAVCTRHERTRETARLALNRRDVPLVVEPAFDELRMGALEGHPFADYVAWRALHRPGDRLAGGESRDDALRRYARGLDSVDEREADVVLVVSHALPIRCILAAAAHGERFDPTRRSVGLATPYLLDGDAVRTAARRLHSLASPSPPRVAHA